MEEVYQFLKTCGTYYLATMDGDQPRVRPFGTVDLFNGQLTIQTGRKKDVAKQMLADAGYADGLTLTGGAIALLLLVDFLHMILT